MKYLFLLLFGFLFISLAEAKTDIKVNEGFETVIKSQDIDLVVMESVVNIEYLVINVCSDINKNTQNKIQKSTNEKRKLIRSRRLSNPGKFINLAYNYVNLSPSLVKYKIPFGLQNRQINSQIM